LGEQGERERERERERECPQFLNSHFAYSVSVVPFPKHVRSFFLPPFEAGRSKKQGNKGNKLKKKKGR